jgi:hypothetical protein
MKSMKRIAKQGTKTLALSAAIVLIPSAAFATISAFSSNNGTPAVTATNSSTAAGTKAVEGRQTGGGANTRYGVLGTANGPGGVGVIGTGTQDGVLSNGPLGIRPGNLLNCTACVTSGDLAGGSVTPGDLSSAAQNPQPLPSGQSESGVYSAASGYSSTAGFQLIGTGISYVRPLAAAIPNSQIVDVAKNSSTANCPGVGRADPGYLCLYEFGQNGTATHYFYSLGSAGGNPTFGAALQWTVDTTVGTPYAFGVYTVTAP